MERSDPTHWMWLAVGWLAMLFSLVSWFPLAVFMVFGLAFCDAPGLPCGTYALLFLVVGGGWAVGAIFVIRRLSARTYDWVPRIATVALALPPILTASFVVLKILE